MEKPQHPDIVAIDNTLKLLRRGKWEMEGEEVLAFYRVFEYWAKRLAELKKPPVVAKPVESPIAAPVPAQSEQNEKKPRKKKGE
jgi:hypothetical protein